LTAFTSSSLSLKMKMSFIPTSRKSIGSEDSEADRLHRRNSSRANCTDNDNLTPLQALLLEIMTVSAHVRALPSDGATKATQEAVWTHVLKVLLDVPDDDNPVALSLVHNGITSFSDLLVFSPHEIKAFTYIAHDRPFPPGKIGRIRAIISLYNDWTSIFGATIDMRTVSREDFNDYICSFYNHDYPLGVFQQQ
jgi:hypothetical protein